MLASIPTATLLGAEGLPLRAEVHVAQGLPGFTVVGLADSACRESRDRVRAAVLSSGLTWPQKRITVNLAPSMLRKSGSAHDLAIAIGVLAASGQVPLEAIEGIGFIGELGLDGRVRQVPGMLPLVEAIDARTVVVAAESKREAELGHWNVVPAFTLAGVVAGLTGTGLDEPVAPSKPSPPLLEADLADVAGQAAGRFALEVAAAGGHPLLLTGQAGSGKTMLARRLAGLLPPLTDSQALATTRIHSAAGLRVDGPVTTPPFRAPHFSSSITSVIGGSGARMRPGEVSLAHNGVLLLDELHEFSRAAIEALLRQPLDEGCIRVTRAAQAVTLPAEFLLVATTRFCDCGQSHCLCSDPSKERFARRVPASLLSKFDLRVDIERPAVADLVSDRPRETSAEVAERVAVVRRLTELRGGLNGRLTEAQLNTHAPLAEAPRRLLEAALAVGTISTRGVLAVRRIARTIADLEGARVIDTWHVEGALELHGRAPAAVSGQ